MIRFFSEFILRTIAYIISTPILLLSLIMVTIVVVIGIIWPGAIYFYPYWNGNIEYVEINLLDDETDQVEMIAIVPNRLLPNRDDYQLRIDTTNLTNDDLSIRMEVNKDQPYIDFHNVDSLPVTYDQQIAPNTTVTEHLEFTLLGESRPQEPVEFQIMVELPTKTLTTQIPIQIDYISAPVFAVVALVLPILAALVRFLFWLIFKT